VTGRATWAGLASEVLRLRRERGWTQAALAAEAGCSQRAVSRLESGAGGCHPATALKIATALGTTIAAMTGDGGDG
jgi:transcriptional regulator with XRE-family HTH domain